ncbi:T9SS type A sorting domain-containing protein [Hymenobacter sp. M29]|uniref:T9SS type A sorting domain-containing protein n=1 Tax=Hymenobacter mellowenesis TaxID=3063995 RepID=A0ABT9A6X9_9BACT|nr:T9SS type A sorting domain-containing protein [Hymenobacter sp. M29]
MLPLLASLLSHAQSTSVVISEVFGGGGTPGAPYTNDFVELYNPTNAAITLTNHSLQYNSATGTSAYTVVAQGNFSVPAHGFFLIQLGSSGGVGAGLTAPDVTGTQNLSATAGRLALVSNTTALGAGVAANTAGVVDFVGYGTSAATYEGVGRAPAPSNTTSIERKARESSTSADMAAGNVDADQGNGFDSDNNNLDFVTRSAPGPQNSSAPAEVLVPIVYYSTKVPGGFLNDPNTYSSTPDGTGPAPANFSTNFLTFVVVGTNRTIDGAWSVTGTNAKVLVQSGASFVVPAAFNFSGTLDLSSNATLVQQNATTPSTVTFGTLDAASTVEYAQTTSFTVPILAAPGYGNLTLRNATKLLSTGTTVVRGNVLVDNVDGAFGGAASSASILSLGGNFTLAGTVTFGPAADNLIQLSATNTTTAQVLDGAGTLIKLFRLTLPANQAGVSLANGTSNLELGNAITAAGGYSLGTNTVLTVGNNTLSFAAGGRATMSGNGALALSPSSNLIFSKNSTTALGTLRLTAGSTQLTNFTLDAAGSNNTLVLPASLTVNGTLTVSSTSTLTIGSGNLLTVNGPVAGTGTLRGAADADLTIGGAGALSSFTIGSSGTTTGVLRNFTLNRAGAVLPLSLNLTVEGALALANGTLSLGANLLLLDGTVASSGGFLSGTSASRLTVAGTDGPVGPVAFSPTGGLLSQLNLNRPSGTLTLTDNPLLVGATTLTSGVLGLGAGVGLTITGVLTVVDPAVARFAGTPTSVLNFTGSGAIGPLAFVAGQDELLGLSLNRTGTIPTAQLLTNLSVNNLTLTSGRIFVQGTAKLQVLPGGSLVGGSSNSYSNTLTLASVTNNMTQTVSLTFPLGVTGQYRPLTLTVTDQVIGTTSYTAHQYEAPSPVRTLPATLVRVSQIRYYNVVQEAGGSSTLGSATIRLSYVAANDLVTPANVSFLRVAMTDPADNTKWKDIGGSGTGSDITSASFTPGPLGDFTLATDIATPPNTNPLPVELTRFAATRQGGGVALAWATATERNSARFEVERSLDGRTFGAVLSLPGQGNSTQLHEYTALDAKAPAHLLYYRLRQVDLDGTVAYSQVLTVAGTDAPAEWTVYPNPTTERLTAALPTAAGRTYRVLNTLGQVVAHGDAATADPTIDVHQLAAGTYFLELRGAAGPQTRRFVKND